METKVMVATLDKLKVGRSAKIEEVVGEFKIRRRLFDMGITPGAELYLRKKAPLGDPIEITIRGYELSLRKSEAACVRVLGEFDIEAKADDKEAKK